jgi:hypothetical protein
MPAPRGLLSFVFAVTAVLLWAPAAAADSLTHLSIGYSDMVVDEANEQVFVSGGPGSASIVVLDFDGNVVTSITGQQGASRMALDVSNSTLYVALEDGDAISKIDTATLTESGRLAVAPKSEPHAVALAGGRVWFGHDCGDPESGMSSMATDGSGLIHYPRTPGTYPWYCPTFATSPTDPNLLIATDLGLSPPKLYVFDVASATHPLTLKTSKDSTGGFHDMVVSPDGTQLLAPFSSPHDIQVFRLSDLETVGGYSTGGFPNSVAVTSDGSYVAAGREGPWDTDLFIYEASASTPQAEHEFSLTEGTGAGTLYRGSLAFTADSSRLFVVTHGMSSTADFRVLVDPVAPKEPTTTTLSASATSVAYNGTVTLTAHVDAHAGGTLSIYATPFNGFKTLVRTAAPSASGNITASYAVKKLTTFTAEYSGDATYAKSWSEGTDVIARAVANATLLRYYGTSGKYRLYRLGANPLIKGSVTPNQAGLYLTFVAQRYRNGAWRFVDSEGYLIGAGGSVSARLLNPSRGTYRVRTMFPGSVSNLADNSPWKYLKVTS